MGEGHRRGERGRRGKGRRWSSRFGTSVVRDKTQFLAVVDFQRFDAGTFFETATNHGFWGLDSSRASSLSGFLPLIWFLWTIELTQCCPGMQRDVPSMQDMLRDGGHGA